MPIIAAAFLAACLCSCGDGAETGYAPAQMAEAMAATQASLPPMRAVYPDDPYFGEYCEGYYRISPDSVSDGAILYAGSLSSEIAVLRLADGAAASEAREALKSYVARRIDVFNGYAPEQAVILSGSVVAARGPYVALIVCDSPAEAERAFYACFGASPEGAGESGPSGPAPGATPTAGESGENGSGGGSPAPTTGGGPGSGTGDGPDTGGAGESGPSGPDPGATPTAGESGENGSPAPTTGGGEGESGPSGPGPGATPTAGESGENGSPTPTTGGGAPEIEGEYDHGAVLAAWQSGDGSGLSPINAAILEACSDVIASLIKAGMGEYEKELALHDWIIWRAEYDEEANSNAPDAAPDPNNDNPYGLMVKGKAICTGYTLTFQLLMDMVGIECLTVRGFSGSLDHAWNMVRIGGEWYCVDVTWNDPSDVAQTEAMNHKYFNVPGDFMRANFHSWDESAFPKATAPKLYFSG